MYHLTIDAVEGTVSISSKRISVVFHRQWVVFYLALALRALSTEDGSAYLEAHELQFLGPWFHKKPGSVGKEVARHLDQLSERGLAEAVLHDGRTKRWRLGIGSIKVDLRPSAQHCDLWLREQQWDLLGGIERVPQSMGAWLSSVTRAIIAMEQGQIKEGLKHIRSSKREHASSTLLGAIGEIVELRLYARIGQYPDPSTCLTQCVGNIGKALLIRAELAQALAPDFETIDLAIENFRRLTLRLEVLPDINGLGTAYNALGVLFRRSKQFDLAERCLRYAAALLVASFDLPTLQAALFNLGHTLYKRGTTRSEMEEALSLISLDREICYALGIGKDSAQAEIVAGTICVKLGELERAEHWLEEGRKIVQVLASDYNKAGVERLYGRILWACAWRQQGGISAERRATILVAFQRAQHLLGAAGFPSQGLDYEMGLVREGQRPPWLPQ